MSRERDNAICASLVITATLKLNRRMDRGNPQRTHIYSFPLTVDAVGSAGLQGLGQELQALGLDIVAKVQSWEGGPRTPGRPVHDPLTRLQKAQAAEALSPIQKEILKAAQA